MPTGSVKWFNNAKGYGFVRPDAGGEDLFVHYSYINMDGYKTLKAGQQVQFDIQPSGNGFHAVNIQAVGAVAATPPATGAPVMPATEPLMEAAAS